MLFVLIFLWTPPHFWALALYRAGDYARAGVPMLPVVAGARATRRQILLYTLVSVPVALAPWYAGRRRRLVYGVGARSLGRAFVAAGRARCCATRASARAQADVRLLDPLSLPALRAADRRQCAGPLAAAASLARAAVSVVSAAGDPSQREAVRAAGSPQRRHRNLALLAALLAFVVLVYLVALVQDGRRLSHARRRQRNARSRWCWSAWSAG